MEIPGTIIHLAAGVGIGAIACLIGMFIWVITTPRF